MSTNAAGERIAAAVRARREALADTQMDIYERGGPSNTTLTKIESGQAESLALATAKKLDRGLLWTPGSAMRVWRGTGEPTLLATGQPSPSGSGHLSAGTVGGSGEDASTLLFRRPDNISDAEWERMRTGQEDFWEWQIDRATRERGDTTPE